MSGAWQSDWQQAADERQALIDERDTLKLACAQFVRYQKEICDLLNEDTEADSIALHTNAVYAIKALKERLDPAPQAPIAKIVVGEDDSLLTMLYAPGLPPGEHDLYCEPASAGRYLPGNSRGD